MLKHMLFGGGIGIKGDSWVATLGGSGDDYGRSVAVGPDGSVYIGGYTESAGAGSSDLLIAKFNSSGTLQWQKTLGGSGDDYGRSVAIGPDGSVYVCGETESAGAGRSDLLIAKFNSSGTLQWQKTLGGSDSDYGYAVAVGPDGSVYVGGGTEKCVVSQFLDAVFAKFSSSGTLQWEINFGSHIYNHLESIAVAHDGSVYAAGSIAGYFSLIKFNESGAWQWQKTLGSFNSGSGLSVTVGPDGSVYVGGHTNSAGAGRSDLLIAKFNSSGTLQWQKTLGGSGDDYGRSVAVGPDGSVYIGGYTESAGAGRSDLLIARITDDVIKQYIVVYSNFTLKDASVTVSDESYSYQTSILSASYSSLSLLSSSNTAKDANLTLTQY